MSRPIATLQCGGRRQFADQASLRAPAQRRFASPLRSSPPFGKRSRIGARVIYYSHMHIPFAGWNRRHTVTSLVLLVSLTGCGGSRNEHPPAASPTLADFRQEIIAPAPPRKMTPGQSFLLAGAVVKNIGQQLWQAGGPNRVELTYNWMTPDGKLLKHGVVTTLAADVPPGQSQALTANIVAPGNPGEYIIRFTMIAENIAWFSDVGGKTLDYPVTVVSQ